MVSIGICKTVGEKHSVGFVFWGFFSQIVVVRSFAISELFKVLSLSLFPLNFKLTKYQMFVINQTKSTDKEAITIHIDIFFPDF